MYIVRWIFFFSDLPLFWLMFCSENLEQLDEYKKGNKNSVFFFSFFYHLRLFHSDLFLSWMVSLLSDFLLHVLCSMDFFFSDLPLFWLIFCFENLEQLDEYKKSNKNSIFFLFFYHLLKSTLFSIIFIFVSHGYFFLRSTYFCSVNQIFGKHNKGWIFEPFTLWLQQ